jgi:hypothetical protein
MGASIDVGNGDDVGAGGKGLENRRRCCRTRGECEGISGIFEGRYGFFKLVSSDFRLSGQIFFLLTQICLKKGWMRGMRNMQVLQLGHTYRFGFALRVYS